MPVPRGARMIGGTVRAVFEEVLGPARGQQAAASGNILDEGHLDSFAMLELAAGLEVAFDIIIPAESLTHERFSSVETIAALCAELTGG